jgi:hypothetical protein
MALTFGVRSVMMGAAANNPHVVGFEIARSAADDTLFEVWNGTTFVTRKFVVDLDGKLYSNAATAGDIMYAVTGGVTGVRRFDFVGIGGENQVLAVVGGVPSWSALGGGSGVGAHVHDTADITTGTFGDARIAQTNVTQHEAALTILETQITDGTLLARVAANETISGDWSVQAGWSFTELTVAPFAVSSTAVVTNLNADTVDGSHASAFALSGHNHDSVYASTAGAETVTGLWTFDRDPGVPFAVTASSAVVPNLNADELDGNHAAAFALSGHTHGAADVVSGTFLNARISESSVRQYETSFVITEGQITDGTILARLAAAETVAGNWNISGAWTFTRVGAPFAVSSSTLVGNLNADTVDGSHASAFAAASHNHDASDINSGQFADIRIQQSNVTQHQGALSIAETQITDGSVLARVASSETITGTYNFSPGAGVTPFTVNFATATVVTNLDADKLDGSHASAFSLSGHNHDATYSQLGHTHSQYAEYAQTETITGSWTFDRDPGSPFIVTAGSALVGNLNVQYLNSQAGTYYLDCANFTGTLADARVQQSNVTQHEAALTIAETQITDGSVLARVAGNETISGNWSIQTGWSFTEVTLAPFAVTSSTVVTNFNADQLDGNHASAFATSGHTHSAYAGIAETETITGAWTFDRDPSAPFIVTATSGVVTNLDADLLDGSHASAFSLTSHVHDTADVTTGTFANARISSGSVTQHEADLTILETQITNGSVFPRLGSAETVTGLWDFSRGAAAPFTVASASATVVTNLDADKLDGNHASAFATLPINASDVNAGTFAQASTYTFSARVDVAGGAVVIGNGTKAEIVLDGADGDIAAGSVGIAENGGTLQLSARNHVQIFLDNDNNATTNVFGIYANVAQPGSLVFSVGEAGQVRVINGHIRMEASSTERGRIEATSYHNAMTISDNLYYDGSGDIFLPANWRYIQAAGANDEAGALLAIKGNGTETGVELAFCTTPESTGADATPVSLTKRFRLLGTGNVIVPNGLLDLTNDADECVRINHTSATGNPRINLRQNGTQRSYIQHVDTNDVLKLASEYGYIELWPGSGGTEAVSKRFQTTQEDWIYFSATAFALRAYASSQNDFTFTGQVGSARNDIGNRSTATTVNWRDGNHQRLRITANVTLTLSNPISGFPYFLEVDRSGNFQVTFPGSVNWGDAGAPTQSNASGEVDGFSFVWNGTEYLAALQGTGY